MKKSYKKIKEDKIYDAMEHMSPQNILILYLRAIKEMTLKEIGERVMLSHEAVRRRLIKITKELQDHGLSE